MWCGRTWLLAGSCFWAACAQGTWECPADAPDCLGATTDPLTPDVGQTQNSKAHSNFNARLETQYSYLASDDQWDQIHENYALFDYNWLPKGTAAETAKLGLRSGTVQVFHDQRGFKILYFSMAMQALKLAEDPGEGDFLGDLRLVGAAAAGFAQASTIDSESVVVESQLDLSFNWKQGTSPSDLVPHPAIEIPQVPVVFRIYPPRGKDAGTLIMEGEIPNTFGNPLQVGQLYFSLHASIATTESTGTIAELLQN